MNDQNAIDKKRRVLAASGYVLSVLLLLTGVFLTLTTNDALARGDIAGAQSISVLSLLLTGLGIALSLVVLFLSLRWARTNSRPALLWIIPGAIVGMLLFSVLSYATTLIWSLTH